MRRTTATQARQAAQPLPGVPGQDHTGVPAESAGGAGRDTLRTEFAFELPRGYVDESGTVHRHGVMRLATARDELIPLRDDRVRENSAYLSVVLIARVITRLGTIEDVVSCSGEMPEGEVGFNSDLLSNVIEAVGTDLVTLELLDSLKPVIARTDNIVALVMPVRPAVKA